MKIALSGRRAIAVSIGWTVWWNGIVPVALYYGLNMYMPSLTALLLAMTAPLAENVLYTIKHRKADAFGLLMAGSFVVGAGAAFWGGSEKLVLARESVVTAFVGCVFLLSLFTRRPLIFRLAERFVPPTGAVTYEERWSLPYVRFVFRLMTAVWGAVLVAEAAVRVVLAFRLSTEQFLLFHNLLFYGVLGVLIVWTARYRKYAMRKLMRLS